MGLRIVRRTCMLLCVLVAVAPACHRRRRFARARTVPIPALFADAPTGRTHLLRWLSNDRMMAPFITAVDGWAAAIEPGGPIRWVRSGNREPVVRASRSPCVFDASRHSTTWTIPPRIALDGRGHACCLHDGSAEAPAGAFCAQLDDATPRWRRAHVRGRIDGLGSGDGAIAMFALDVQCTRDGGATMFATFRGDYEQSVSAASCNARGAVVAVAGTRSVRAEDEQTIRRAAAGESLAFVPGSPRGSPVDVRIRADGAFAVLLRRRDDGFVAWGDRDGHVREELLPGHPGHAIGAWGPTRLIVTPRAALRVADGVDIAATRTIEGDQDAEFVATTRVGRFLISVTRDGAFGMLDR